MTSTTYRAVLHSTEELSPIVRSFHLRIGGGGARFSHRPGQWISVKIPTPEGIQERAYSIASPPRPDSTLELCVRRISDGLAGSYFWSLKVGAPIEFSGPFGKFLLQEPLERDSVFIANGTGITPLRPMIRQALRATNGYQVTLLFGVRNEAELLYRSEWETLQERHRNFLLVPTFSRPEPSWRGR
ncbi:MAG: FAD-dependent oxidoreductase, partial [Acidobacteriota bacterium]